MSDATERQKLYCPTCDEHDVPPEDVGADGIHHCGDYLEPEAAPTPDLEEAVRECAKDIYETHKVESMTMPCFGLPVDDYVAQIANGILAAVQPPFAKLQEDIKTFISALRTERKRLTNTEQQRDKAVRLLGKTVWKPFPFDEVHTFLARDDIKAILEQGEK